MKLFKNNAELNFQITMSKVAAWWIAVIAPFKLDNSMHILEAWGLAFLMLATKQAIEAYKEIKNK